MDIQHQINPIIRTKLYVPTMIADHVSRGRLIDLMDRALEVPLTLVSAPPGYGKSVLVSEWVRLRGHSAAWLSLDESDGDLRQFLSYLAAAIDSVSPDACSTVLGLLGAPELPPLPLLTACLINGLDDIDSPIVVVFDDYHCLARTSPVHELLENLLRHPPSNIHIVLITRRDPPLSMVRLRAGNRIAEVRLRDLQFSGPETADLLAATAGHTIGADALANLQAEVEGWAAGLRLVSLAVRHTKDPDAILQAMHGGVPQTQEYLLIEVLGGLSYTVREFLLKSSILNRFCADTIEAICCPDAQSVPFELSGQEFIELLQRDNIFAISLDADGRWFRFHHLFQALLRRQLRQQSAPGDIEQLHLRASVWFEGQNLIDEAILYALKTQDANSAADIVERHYHRELNQDRFYVLEGWIGRLPAKITQRRPALLLGHAYVALFRQQPAKMIPILDQVESLLDNEAENGDLRIELKFFRGYIDFWEGNTEQSQRELEAVVSEVHEEKRLLLAEAKVHLSLSRYMNGEKAIAIEGLKIRAQKTASAGSLLLPRMIGSMAIIHLLSGDLPQARYEGKRMRESAISSQSRLNISWAYYLEGLSQLHCMDLGAALDHFSAGTEHPYSTDARAAVDALSGLALTRQLMRQPEAAITTVQRLIKFAAELNDPALVDVARSCEARISLLQGNLAQAVDWAKSASPPLDRLALLIWLESPPIIRARVLIAEGSTECLRQASELLREIRELSEVCRFTCQIIEVAVLQALLLERQGGRDAALVSLQEALDLAEPGGWVRPFAELGRPMAELLEQLARKGAEGDFIHRALASAKTDGAFAPAREILAATPSTAPARGVQAAPARAGTTPGDLTNRELDILEMLMQRLQNKEIASRLFISTHTVNYHLKHIYQKLGVSNRRQAVAEAVKMEINPPS